MKSVNGSQNGRGGMIRTYDPLLPKQEHATNKLAFSAVNTGTHLNSSKPQLRQITADSCQGSALSRHKYDTMSLAEAICLIGGVIAIAFAVYWYGGFNN